MHAFKTKILGTFLPLFSFANAFSKALIGKSRGICPQVVWQCSSAQIAVRDKENRVFYLKLVYEMITNQAMHARTPPPPPLGEPESKKIGFSAVRPVFLQVQRSISAKP